MIIGPGSSTCGSISNGDCIKGRVTVASGQDVVIGDDIDYVTPGTDVLGVIAQNNVWVASWTGNSLSWRAAALAENGVWSQPNGVSNGSHSGTMTFTGSTATNQGGAMSMFAHRSYNYDTTLQYLQPPWFPTLQSAYTVLLYRSLPNSS
jgi:predicted outer membrane repeat protein